MSERAPEKPRRTRHRLNGAERWWRAHRERLDPYHAFVFGELLELAHTSAHADYLADYAREMMASHPAEPTEATAGEPPDVAPSRP